MNFKISSRLNQDQISLALVFLYVVGLVVLIWSVVLSGYHFQFNADEIFNANTIYLMVKGYKPYVDFYTVYSPILHWILTPVFWLFGFNFGAISVARIVMIFLFFVRLILMFLLVARVFGRRVGYLFLPLYLMSPFVVFSEMQIRPDNLMMVFYTLFLLVFSYEIDSSPPNRRLRMTGGWLSGILFAVTLLTNIKIVPSLAAFGLVFFYFVLQKRNFSQLWRFINGFCLTFLAFFAYFLIKGYAGEMFLHVFLDPVRLNNSIPYPTWLGYFYFSNPTIYGLEGKPMNWLYAWSLPVLAFAGGYKSLLNSEGNTHAFFLNIIKIILFVSLIFQWASMLFINSVFIQYYIPLNWLYAVFTAYLIDDLLFKTEMPKILQEGLFVIFVIFFAFLYKTSIKANNTRSKIISDPIIKETEELWKIIPQESPAFPNIIFRRPIYPILWGSTFAPYMRERFPPAYLAIEKYKLPVLVGLNDEYFSYLDSESQQYILTHYMKDERDNRIWKRKNN